MAIISGINDIKAKCINNNFKKCKVVFRKGHYIPSGLNEINLSELLNISLVQYKDTILCYCDGLKQKKELSLLEELLLYEDVELENPFDKYSPADKEDLKEDIEFLYQKEKKDWIRRFSNNENLIKAIDAEYDCDQEYCLARLNVEYPGFMLVDETTFFYKVSCPSLQALNLEQRLKSMLNIVRDRYGTYARIVKLDQHNHINYHDQEAMVLFNYLNKFDVFALMPIVQECLYGK